jgi:hypothetical protein
MVAALFEEVLLLLLEGVLDDDGDVCSREVAEEIAELIAIWLLVGSTKKVVDATIKKKTQGLVSIWSAIWGIDWPLAASHLLGTAAPAAPTVWYRLRRSVVPQW